MILVPTLLLGLLLVLLGLLVAIFFPQGGLLMVVAGSGLLCAPVLRWYLSYREYAPSQVLPLAVSAEGEESNASGVVPDSKL